MQSTECRTCQLFFQNLLAHSISFFAPICDTFFCTLCGCLGGTSKLPYACHDTSFRSVLPIVPICRGDLADTMHNMKRIQLLEEHIHSPCRPAPRVSSRCWSCICEPLASWWFDHNWRLCAGEFGHDSFPARGPTRFPQTNMEQIALFHARDGTVDLWRRVVGWGLDTTVRTDNRNHRSLGDGNPFFFCAKIRTKLQLLSFADNLPLADDLPH